MGLVIEASSVKLVALWKSFVLLGSGASWEKGTGETFAMSSFRGLRVGVDGASRVELVEGRPTEDDMEVPACDTGNSSSLYVPVTYRTSTSTQLSRSASLSAHRTCRALEPPGPRFASIIRKACLYSLSSSASFLS